MDELKQDLKKVLSQVNKIDAVELKLTGISAQITGIENRLSTLEGRATSLEQQHAENVPKINKIGELEKSCEFLSKKYDDLLKRDNENNVDIAALQVDIRTIAAENVKLKGQISNVRNSLEQEKIGRNQDAQHARTSLNVKLCGVPVQLGEDERTPNPSNPVTFAVVNKVCDAAGISLAPGSIDVCHRLGNYARSPIIIRFQGKGVRFSFFNQRHKLKSITSLDVDFRDLPTITPRASGPPRGPPRQQSTTASSTSDGSSKIFLQEHLTKYTKGLLKITKEKLTEEYDFPGYVMNGEVRCRKKEGDKFECVQSIRDLKKIMTESGIPYEDDEFDDIDGNWNTLR